MKPFLSFYFRAWRTYTVIAELSEKCDISPETTRYDRYDGFRKISGVFLPFMLTECHLSKQLRGALGANETALNTVPLREQAQRAKLTA